MNWILHKLSAEDPYTRLPNDLLQNEVLTYEARGLLAELLSRPDNWIVQRAQLLREYAKDEKLRRITQELRDAGYMFLHQGKDPDSGYFINKWIVSDTPLAVDQYLTLVGESPAQPNDPSGLADGRSARLGQTPILKKNDITNTRITKMSGRSDLPDSPYDSPCLPKLYFKKRWPTESLPYKLGELLVDMVQKRRPGQFARYLTTDEGRHLLIQKQAYYFDSILERDGRPIEELLEVLQWSQEDDFWKDNIRSAETFRRQYGVLLKQMEEKGIGSMRVDHNSDLTQSLIRSYRGLIANPNFQPSPVQHTKFIVGAEKMVEFFHHYREVERSSWCECLTECLEKEYSDNSKPVYPGHYCSDHTWQVLMPQYLLDAGLVVWDSQEEIADVTQT